MSTKHQLVTIFCQIDDFCNKLDDYTKHYFLDYKKQNTRGPDCSLTSSEIMTILVMFHVVRFRDFKTFYCDFVCNLWKPEFPNLPSYSRFINIMKRAIFPLTLFTHIHSGKHSGIYYVDSSCLPVCHLKRSRRNKVFKGIADYGKTSVGWFFGLKLHLIINSCGELIGFRVTSGNANDCKAAQSLFAKIKGFVFGDKGYIDKKISESLLQNGLKLITRKRKNMQPEKLTSIEQQLLNKRSFIETTINKLKSCYNIWHTRHRSIINALTHLTAAMVAYVIEPLKLSAMPLLTCF